MVEQQTRLDLDEATFLELGNTILQEIYHNRPAFGKSIPRSSQMPLLSGRSDTSKLPIEGGDPKEIIHHILADVMPQNLPTHHPAFLAFIPSPGSMLSVLGNLMADGYNVFAGHWLAGRGAAQIESTVLNWLTQIFEFPVQTAGGVFTSGGSMANLSALVAARVDKLGDNWEKGIFYYSEQTHSSWEKAARILGFKPTQYRAIPVDRQMKIDTDSLVKQIQQDLHNGLKPFCLTGNAGTTNTGTIDQLDTLAAIAKEYNLWFHIDGAYGAASILAPKRKAALKGIELADSLTLDPHKWWFQVYELGCLMVRDKRKLRNAFQVGASYLEETKNRYDEAINYYEYGPQLTRSFKALKFYLTLKSIGLQNMGQLIEKGISNAEWVEDRLKSSSNWQIISEAQLGILTFRYQPQNYSGDLDALNRQISHTLISEGKIFLITTTLNGQLVLRMCPIHPDLTFEHLEEIVDDLERVAEETEGEK